MYNHTKQRSNSSRTDDNNNNDNKDNNERSIHTQDIEYVDLHSFHQDLGFQPQMVSSLKFKRILAGPTPALQLFSSLIR